MSDSSSWKQIRVQSFIPLRCQGVRTSLVINMKSHGHFVTDKCRLRLTERTRRNYNFRVKGLVDFRKLGRKKYSIKFSPVRSTPGICRFWKGYRLPSIKVSIVEWRELDLVLRRISFHVVKVCSPSHSPPQKHNQGGKMPICHV